MKRNLAIIASLVAMAAILSVTPGSAAVSQKAEWPANARPNW
jgi:hypothetical protein